MMALEMNFLCPWGLLHVSNRYMPGIISYSMPVTSGETTFDLLPPQLKSIAVRSKVEYAPHPYVWMSPARALPTGLGIESEGKEVALDEIPEWERSKIKIFPMVLKFYLNPEKATN